MLKKTFQQLRPVNVEESYDFQCHGIVKKNPTYLEGHIFFNRNVYGKVVSGL